MPEQALLDAKQGLEERVAQRTQELREALEAQRLAKQEAERANSSKTRFVAAASHDLLQPLNAARLFASALESRVLRFRSCMSSPVASTTPCVRPRNF